MIYFSRSITNFLHENKYLPWDNMKFWTCPNKVCPNYKQHVVQLDTEIILGLVYGYFMCPTCGYIYLEGEGDSLGPIEIISRGPFNRSFSFYSCSDCPRIVTVNDVTEGKCSRNPFICLKKLI